MNRQVYTIPLDKNGRIAVLGLPVPITAADIAELHAWLNLLVTLPVEEEGGNG